MKETLIGVIERRPGGKGDGMMVQSNEKAPLTKGGVPKVLLGKKDVRRINFDVTAEEFYKLKTYAVLHRTTVSKIFRQHIADLVATIDAWKTTES